VNGKPHGGRNRGGVGADVPLMPSQEEPESRSDRGGTTVELEARVDRGPWGLEVGSPTGVSTRRLLPGEQIILGSARHADLRVSDPSVSGRHARIAATDAGILVEDLGSKNGLFVGGARVGRATLSGAGCGFVAGCTTVTLRHALEVEAVSDTEGPIEGIVGCSAPMRRLAQEVRRVARLRRPVLVHGESGSGKELVAQALHRLSGRAGSFVPLNAGTIAESLADAELFGHRRGSFTGAVSTRRGAFEEAHQGTLFLDEVADLPLAVQVKLLRVVEDGVVRAVGGGDPVAVDVRLVTATWADLHARAVEGRFRADLLHRVSALVIEVPPLRERLSDLPLLCEAFLTAMAPELGEKRLTAAARGMLSAYRFPGNVRELWSILYRAAAAAPGPVVDTGHVGLSVMQRSPDPRRLCRPEAHALLERHGGNVSAAARAAGVPRSTFRFWLAGRESGRKKGPAPVGS
jgi:hypothetical protein